MATKLTKSQLKLLEAVHGGMCQRWSADYIIALLPGNRDWETVTVRANALADRGLIDLLGNRTSNCHEARLTEAGCAVLGVAHV